MEFFFVVGGVVLLYLIFSKKDKPSPPSDCSPATDQSAKKSTPPASTASPIASSHNNLSDREKLRERLNTYNQGVAAYQSRERLREQLNAEKDLSVKKSTTVTNTRTTSSSVSSNNTLSASEKLRAQLNTFNQDVATSQSRERIRERLNAEKEDNELATFVVSEGPKEQKSKNKKPGRWIRLGEPVDVKGKNIRSGGFYLGGKLRAYSSESSYFTNQETESSLVDDSLSIRSTTFSYSDDSLGYWPKFINLSPEGRGAYLDWLSSNRNNPQTPLGYIFIYFYGLERRVLIDSAKGEVSDTEYAELFSEVGRLREVYGENRSFWNYSSRLMEVMSIMRPNIAVIDSSQSFLLNDSLLFKFNLAKTVSAGKTVSADLALHWIKFYPEYSLRTPARRCESEFSKLFKKRYEERFGEGITVKPNKTKLKLHYYPASSTLIGFEIEQVDLPDPSILKGPVKKLISIAEQCTEQLEAYSRYLGKKGTSRDDLAAVLLLPDDAKNDNSPNVITHFKKWANGMLETSGGVVSVSDFWGAINTPCPLKLNKKEIELMQNLTSKAGFGFAPDPRYHHVKPSTDGELVLFDGGHGEFFEPSKAFNEVGMALRLGAMVAKIDSVIDESESQLLKNLIAHDTKLSPSEKSSLNAYLTWRLKAPSNVIGLKGRIEKLGDSEKAAFSHILVGVALADGRVDPSEIKQLEKLYTMLGLDKALVSTDIHQLSTSGRATHHASTPHKYSSGFSLDKTILAIHESETNDVQGILATIFSEDEAEEHEEGAPTVASGALDVAHSQLYRSLKEKEEWPRDDVLQLCQKLGLMLEGAVEVINDWSFEKVDAPVLDDDQYIYVDLEIVSELEG